MTTPLWKDLIEIPEQRSTFVLKLTEGLERAEETIANYVITPSLAEHFDDALRTIEKGLLSNKSQGAFLHGSFGSGKSHFMAMLSLLLQGNEAALQLNELGGVVTRHDWLHERKLLMIPYHMLDARSMEQAVFDGYIRHIKTIHPNAPLPGVFLSDEILTNADHLREKMGDEAFFKTLNENQGSDDGWGSLSDETWNAETYATASSAPADSTDRIKLTGVLVERLLTSVVDAARVADAQKYVPFDDGLQIITRHARELGYDGLVLFLDELILWLSRGNTDKAFVQREINKIPKLVESQNAVRDVPIFSFVARQRDLQEMLGSNLMGEDRQSLDSAVDWWQGRFSIIRLEDSNLPEITSQRLLRPNNAQAAELIRQSFDSFSQELVASWRNILVTEKDNEDDFRSVYPFSPALVRTLVVLSATLQRERTSLKLMQSLLIERRDDLKLGDIIPLGDLWDVIASGEEPTHDLTRRAMSTARRLWEHKIRPVLLRTHNEDTTSPGFQNDARLLKTLLIAAIVPQFDIFEGITADRLIALNYGSVKAPIRGMEAGIVLKKMRQWSTEISELSLEGTDPANPIIKLRLADVDIEPLLRQADSADNVDNRRRILLKLLFEELDLKPNGMGEATLKMPWRGANRTATVYYGNVREMPLERIVRQGNDWHFVIDFPFDEGDYTPADDIARLRAIPDSQNTLAWLPSFFSRQVQNNVGRLLRLQELDRRFDDYTRTMRADERPTARKLVENNMITVRQSLIEALKVAYGLNTDTTDLIDSTQVPKDHLFSLNPQLRPRLSTGASFAETLRNLFTQALKMRYPGAPAVPNEALRSKTAQAILDTVRASIASEERRIFVEKGPLRETLHTYADPLKLGVMGETHFSHKTYWQDHFDQALRPSHEPLPVGELLHELESPETPTGMPPLLAGIIVLTYAALEDMRVVRLNGDAEPGPGDLHPTDQLQRRELPEEADWKRARELARAIFDIDAPSLRNARNLEQLANHLERAAGVAHCPTEALVLPEKLMSRGTQSLALDSADIKSSARYEVARTLRNVLQAVRHPDPTQRVTRLAGVDLAQRDPKVIAMAFKRAADHLHLLNNDSLWQPFHNLVQLTPRNAAEEGLLTEIQQTFLQWDQSKRLSELEELNGRTNQLFFERSAQTAPAPATPPGPPTAPQDAVLSGPGLSPDLASSAALAEPPQPQPQAATDPRRHFELSASQDPADAMSWLQSTLDDVRKRAPKGARITLSIRVDDE